MTPICRICGERTDQLDPGGRPAHPWCRRRHTNRRRISEAVNVEETAEDGLVHMGHLHDCFVCGGSTWLALDVGLPIHRRCLRTLFVEDGMGVHSGSLVAIVERCVKYGYGVNQELHNCVVCSEPTYLHTASLGPAHLLCWVS